MLRITIIIMLKTLCVALIYKQRYSQTLQKYAPGTKEVATGNAHPTKSQALVVECNFMCWKNHSVPFLA